MEDAVVKFVAIFKQYGNFHILKGVDLEIRRGEFLTLLGPSGCGKTTLLRLLAGFEDLTSGDILIEGRSIRGVRPHQRPVGMVFQNLALFPHLTVEGNVSYGLLGKKLTKQQMKAEVEGVLSLVGLSGFNTRKIGQLSGGQRQRVALARSLVVKPKVLLLDEPFSALDVKLRLQLQGELKSIQQRVGTTFVFVTHDQDEALAMSDRIVVMNKGCVEQIGTPEEIYHRPSTEFVARFVGEANLFTAESGEDDRGDPMITVPKLALTVPFNPPAENAWPRGCFCIRPEAISLTQHHIAGAVPAEVLNRRYSGSSMRLDLTVHGTLLICRVPSNHPLGPQLQVGSKCFASVDSSQIVFLPDSAQC
ncbi:ABC transporter ATP-binding protein [Caballeronia sp. dw_19]|uniref:ABC transporter ATP-binding protein n=1 Tax=Caballeronia sp. dw_19 TaxID=2719791 RepID=UPI001BCBE8CA|nr:ABC transporter ATP-binding protein [Caballeronia sp. dw_19]